MISNLAIKGGGVKGVAYVGALEVLDKAGMLAPINRVAGTSAGALMATMICAGHDVPAIEQLMKGIQFKEFKKGWNPIRLFTSYGLYSGDYILDYISLVLSKSPLGLTSESTFQDMRNAGCKDLYVFSCNTNLQTVMEFSAEKTPQTKVAEAVRASMSIPWFFKAWRFPGGGHDGHLFIDGGVVYNYPLSFFDEVQRFNADPDVNCESLGLYLLSRSKTTASPLKFNQPLQFASQVFESLLATQDLVIQEDREQFQRSVVIDDLGIPATDFNISPDQMNQLMESGRQGALNYLGRLANTQPAAPTSTQKTV
jgi:NTE family protein